MNCFRSQNLDEQQHGKRCWVGGYYVYCKHSLQEPSFPGPYALAGHEQHTDRWRVCSIDIGKPSSVRRLDSTFLGPCVTMDSFLGV